MHLQGDCEIDLNMLFNWDLHSYDNWVRTHLSGLYHESSVAAFVPWGLAGRVHPVASLMSVLV